MAHNGFIVQDGRGDMIILDNIYEYVLFSGGRSLTGLLRFILLGCVGWVIFGFLLYLFLLLF